MAVYKVVRIYPSDDVWVVKKDGASRASAIKNTKSEAIEVAKDIARNQSLRLIIHGRDGRIQENIGPQRHSESNCFITTACVTYYGLADDCRQLQTLRRFRDAYLLGTVEDTALLTQYYSVAPTIVARLQLDENKAALFDQIFKSVVKACAAIDTGQFELAKSIYKESVVSLLAYFKLPH